MSAERSISPLPSGARLFHIGIPKTGTTAVQSAAAARRDQLAVHGVCYPGRGLNHLEPVCAFMGRSFGWTSGGGGVPPRARWSGLMSEVRHAAGRVLISHEFASESTDDQARRFVAELGEQTYVVITLRSFAALLGSSWQQYVKAGRRQAFEPWLGDVLADQPSRPAARFFYRRNDQPAILRRWIDAAGSDRVIVVIPDKGDPALLFDAFSGLLGLPPEVLRGGAEEADRGENRSMSWPEVEFLRRLNGAVQERLDWRHYEIWIRNGAVAKMLTGRRPGPTEEQVTLPEWAARRANEIAASYAEEVRDSGCRVIGDVERLAEPGSVGDLRAASVIPTDAAVAATAGLVSASLGQGPDFDVGTRPLPPKARILLRSPRGRRVLELNGAVPTATAGDLCAVTLLRAARQLRRRLSH